jgi:hypothetical protein
VYVSGGMEGSKAGELDRHRTFFNTVPPMSQARKAITYCDAVEHYLVSQAYGPLGRVGTHVFALSR